MTTQQVQQIAANATRIVELARAHASKVAFDEEKGTVSARRFEDAYHSFVAGFTAGFEAASATKDSAPTLTKGAAP